MDDARRRMAMLKYLYNHRLERPVEISPGRAIAELPGLDPAEYLRACEDLAALGQIEWSPLEISGRTVLGDARISRLGLRLMKRAPVRARAYQRRAGLNSSQQQVIMVALNDLLDAIDQGDSAHEDKQEAKALVAELLRNNAVASVLEG